jgi:hypothetical protein
MNSRSLCFAIPRKANQAVVDSFCNGVFLNPTTAVTHPIVMTEFHNDLEKMGWPIERPVILIFVVPSYDLLHQMKRQSVSYGKVTKPADSKYCIEQFVMLLESNMLFEIFSKAIPTNLEQMNEFFTPLVPKIDHADLNEAMTEDEDE